MRYCSMKKKHQVQLDLVDSTIYSSVHPLPYPFVHTVLLTLYIYLLKLSLFLYLHRVLFTCYRCNTVISQPTTTE